MKYIIIIAFALVTFGQSQSQNLKNTKKDTQPLLKYGKTIDSLMQISFERGIFNGNVIISKQNSIIYKKSLGYTNGSRTTMLNDLSIFSIGSIAKEFNAVSIAILAEKGLLDLEDTIDKFMPDLPDWSKEIKIKHLLQYSSGLPQISYANVTSEDDIYKDLKNLSNLKFKPGEGYNYNNNSIFIQQRIIEQVSNHTFEEFVIQNIILPLNLKSAVFDPKDGYQNLVKAFDNDFTDDEFYEPVPKGWLHLTNKDLHQYTRALHSGKIITNQSLRKLFNNNYKGNQASLGNTKFQDGQLILHTHHGSNYNFEAYSYYHKPLELLITLTTNNKSFKLHDIAFAIENIFKDKEFDIPKASVYLAIRKVFYKNIDQGINYYFQLKSSQNDKYNFSDSNELNNLGYKFIERGQLKDAIKIFQLMVKEFPNDSNAYDSLGEAYMHNKQYQLSIKNYKKSLKLNPKNTNAEKMIAKIKSI